MAVAVATFLIALALIATERLHRTKVALLGAAIVVLFVAGFGQEKAIESVDFNTIGLLAGMMILVYLTQQTGVYDYIAVRAGQLSRGRPLRGRAQPGGDDGAALGVPGQPDDDPARRPGHVPARRRARHRPDPADHDRGDRIEHRRDRDADRRPAEHHHRRRDRPQLQRVPRQPGADRASSPSRSSIAGCSTSSTGAQLQIAPREPPLRHGARRGGLDPRLRASCGARARPRRHDPRLLRPSGAPRRAGHGRPDGRRRRAAGHHGSRSSRRSRRSSGRRCSSSSRCSSWSARSRRPARSARSPTPSRT